MNHRSELAEERRESSRNTDKNQVAEKGRTTLPSGADQNGHHMFTAAFRAAPEGSGPAEAFFSSLRNACAIGPINC